MQLSTFIIDGRAVWDELDRLTRRAEGRGGSASLDGSDVLALGRGYRRAAADLAVARRSFPHDPVTAELEALVARARLAVYGVPPPRRGARDFVTRRFWWQVRARPVPLLLAALALFGPALLSGVWAHREPAVAATVQSMGSERGGQAAEGEDLGLSLGEQSNMASQIITNNVTVTLMAFAGGITGGALTILTLVFNGLILGTLSGLAVRVGQGRRVLELVAPHGVLELSLIVVAGAAGLRLGWSAVAPGHRTRGESLRAEAVNTLELVLGCAAGLVVAGLIEGFVTPRAIGAVAATVVGLVSGGAFWALVLWRGKPIAETLQANR